MLPWDRVEVLRDQGVFFANHSHGHPHTGDMLKGETPARYEERLSRDTLRARDLLRSHGIDNDWYAYPYGEWTPRFEGALLSLGYRMLFSQNPGVASPGGNVGTPVPRMAIVGGEVALDDFKRQLSRLPLHAELLQPSPGWTEGTITGIEISIPGLASWGTGEVNLFVSEKGRLDPAVDVGGGIIRLDGPIILDRTLNRIIVSARDRATGNYRLKSWLLLKP